MAGASAGVSPAVECGGLTKHFGAIEALGAVDLVVPRGTTFGLLGPNGAGKTTTMRILLGLTAPDTGHASVLGEPVPPRSTRPRIGYMPQDLAIYLDLTVAQNLALFGRLYGLDEGTIERRTDSVLGFMELLERKDDVASTLSAGMRRRASLAAALLHNPDLLLLDEPTVGVDPELRASFWSFFRRLTERGKTVVLTTHYMEEAARCDLVAFMHRGRILARGSPAEIKQQTHTENLDDAFLAIIRSGGDSK